MGSANGKAVSYGELTFGSILCPKSRISFGYSRAPATPVRPPLKLLLLFLHKMSATSCTEKVVRVQEERLRGNAFKRSPQTYTKHMMIIRIYHNILA